MITTKTQSYDDQADLHRLQARLKDDMAHCIERNWHRFPDGRRYLLVSDMTYYGYWPDDLLFSLAAFPDLIRAIDPESLLALLTDSIVDLPHVPDRVEPDGLPIMRPGYYANPHSAIMPLHLPAAWIRLLSYFEAWGFKIPRKQAWARVIQRSIERVPFSCGLAYVDPQIPYVGFGYFDTNAITGFELMSSLVLYKGLLRGAELFKDCLNPDTLTGWREQAERIPASITRLFDESLGGFIAGSKDCRQVSVWANGLAHGLPGLSAQMRDSIPAFLARNRQKIFFFGYTRQIVEEQGWQRLLRPVTLGTYTNGGYWATGTGYVFPVLYQHDAQAAVQLMEQLVESHERMDFPEWVDASGQEKGARRFLMGLALPILAIQCVLEDKPLLELF